MTGRADTDADNPRTRVHERLGARLALMLALAMLPLGLLGMVQSQSVTQEAAARSQLTVMGETVRAATPEIKMIRAAQTIAATLAATVQPFLDDGPGCSRMMAAVAAQEPGISLVAYVPLSGLMTCTSTGKPFDFSTHPLFPKVAGLDAPGFVVNPKGPVSGTSVLGISHPVYAPDGQRIGFISISVPHVALTNVQLAKGQATATREPVALLTFDTDGTILTSSIGLQDAPLRLPSDFALTALKIAEPSTFSGMSAAGFPGMFSVVPIADGLTLMGVWSADTPFSLFGVALEPYFFPLILWLSAMTVALLATEKLVNRHMRRLGVAMKSFSGGARKNIDLDLAGSPVEFRVLGQSFEAMTATILREEAQLEDALRQKEHLLREVHHRTGNSLQLIASIMRMHMRQEKSETVLPILQGLHDRVMGLATVHMGLYQTSGQKDVQMDELVSGVIRQITALNIQKSRKPRIDTRLDPLRLIPDQAVPLSLLLTELLAGIAPPPGDEAGAVMITLVEKGEGRGELRITAPVLAPGQASTEPTPTVIGTQLVRGFAEQIGGQLQVASTDQAFDVIVDFPIRDSNAD